MTFSPDGGLDDFAGRLLGETPTKACAKSLQRTILDFDQGVLLFPVGSPEFSHELAERVKALLAERNAGKLADMAP